MNFAAASVCTRQNCTAGTKGSSWTMHTQESQGGNFRNWYKNVIWINKIWLIILFLQATRTSTTCTWTGRTRSFLGQNQDVWCRTHKVVNASVLRDGVTYDSLNGPSCYEFRFQRRRQLSPAITRFATLTMRRLDRALTSIAFAHCQIKFPPVGFFVNAVLWIL